MRAAFLDAGPLGLASNPNASPDAEACWDAVISLVSSGVAVYVPEISYYEVRRELLRAEKRAGLARLDLLVRALRYAPISTEAMTLAAELWARVRKEGMPTSGNEALDGDPRRASAYRGFRIGRRPDPDDERQAPLPARPGKALEQAGLIFCARPGQQVLVRTRSGATGGFLSADRCSADSSRIWLPAPTIEQVGEFRILTAASSDKICLSRRLPRGIETHHLLAANGTPYGRFFTPDGRPCSSGWQTKYVYDAPSRQRSRTDENGFATLQGYDNYNRVISIQAPNGTIITQVYDANRDRNAWESYRVTAPELTTPWQRSRTVSTHSSALPFFGFAGIHCLSLKIEKMHIACPRPSS